jgi:hypothetical protein
MHAAALRMRAEFMSSAAYLHRTESGTARQQILRDFLARYLPGHVKTFNSAELVTVDGEVSRQCDIVIADRNVPPLLGSKTYRILPNECVYGVIEVKSDLDKSQLLDACELIQEVKSYPKKAFGPNLGPYGSRTVHGKPYEYCPTTGVIFAFDSTDLRTLGMHLLEWCDAREPDVWPDSVWVLGKGSLLWTNPVNGLIDEYPEDGSGLLALRPAEDEDILFPFVIQMSLHFTTAWMPPLRLIDYAGDAPMGTASSVLRRPRGE